MLELLRLFWKYQIPRSVILMIDLIICSFSLLLAFLIRFDFENIPEADKHNMPLDFMIVLGIRLFSFLISGIYKGVVRFTSTRDAGRILLTILTGSMTVFLLNVMWYGFSGGRFFIPNSVIIADALCSSFFLISSRLAVKAVYLESINPSSEKKNVLIAGAGEAGVIVKQSLERDASLKFNVVGFLDDDVQKQGKKFEGVHVYPFEELEHLIHKYNVHSVIISSLKISPERKLFLSDVCLPRHVELQSVPPANRWLRGELTPRQLRSIRIEDLLDREPIRLNNRQVEEMIRGKVIMITGAAGSIGSELARQCYAFRPAKLYLLDLAETPLYELELEFQSVKNSDTHVEVALTDIRNPDRMEKAFSVFKPQIVFHAAAYKHVPMMENNPSESVYTNIFGTKVIADAALRHGVEKFIFISTDKAVNPTGVMGASKRIAEMYVQSLNALGKTRFITTRFGNVLGSNGSVISRFYKQIENLEPVTVTHPDITRYFMTIPEACQLVLEAASMGKGGEIYVFDMGKPVRIADLAKKMIRLAGLEEGKDIQIVYTGLRPGEKLYEELLADSENTLPTHHPKILIGKTRPSSFEDVDKGIRELIDLFAIQDNERIVRKMKELVPEYKSNASVYEKMDR